ncbi:oligoendopeptidase F [Bacillus sp. FSL W7-1360]
MTTYQSRDDVPTAEKWDLTDIYPDIASWQQEADQCLANANELNTFDGHIQDGKSLLAFLEKQEKTSFMMRKLFAYAMLFSDIDTRNAEAQQLQAKASQLGVKLSEATSFFLPFLLSLEEETLRGYIQSEKALAYFEDELWKSFRFKAHVLPKDQEALLSKFGETFSAPSDTFNMYNSADIQFGDITNDSGEKVQLTRGMYAKLIEDENREKRKEAYKAYYKPYVEMNNTIATIYAAEVKKNTTISNMRGYNSTLAQALFNDNIDLRVYEQLIETAKANIEPLHAYTRLRKDKLGVDEIRQYDLNVPITPGVKMDIQYDEAYEMMLTALAPLGKDYVDTLSSFKDKRYIDVRETPGKRSGAYNLGVYGVHPFVLLNHHDDLSSLFTLAHEMGHAMHSYYSSKHQPQITAQYRIFVAEVASTVNEILLINHMLEKATDRNTRAYLLNHFIEQFRSTFFTQVMFADFEKQTHERAKDGEPLDASSLNTLYENLFRTYNGPDLVFDDEVKYGWSRIPHFYRAFYVFQYATGFAAAIQIATDILAGKEDVRDNYLTFLQSGSADFPLALLQKVGVDLTTSAPVEAAMEKFRELVEELESV